MPETSAAAQHLRDLVYLTTGTESLIGTSFHVARRAVNLVGFDLPALRHGQAVFRVSLGTNEGTARGIEVARFREWIAVAASISAKVAGFRGNHTCADFLGEVPRDELKFFVTLKLCQSTGTMMQAKRSFHQRAGALAVEEGDGCDSSEETIIGGEAEVEKFATTVILDDKEPKERTPRRDPNPIFVPDTPSPGTIAALAAAIDKEHAEIQEEAKNKKCAGGKKRRKRRRIANRNKQDCTAGIYRCRRMWCGDGGSLLQ